MNMNITMIAGTVGRDAELRNTQSGDAVLSFPIAVDNGKDRNGNKREATWFDCSVWGKRAQSLSNYITKGAKLAVTGRVGAREHNGKVYLQLSVNELSFMGGSKQNDTAQYNQEPQQQVQSSYMEDEIPF